VRIAIVLEYLPVHTWREQWWGVALARGLAARGHDVFVLCDGAFDPAAFGDQLRVELRRPGRGARRPHPVRFPRWVARRVRSIRVDAVLSLTALVPSRSWLPIERAGEAMSNSMRSGPLALMLEVMEQPALPLASAVEALRRPRRCLRIGPPAAGGTAIGFLSTIDPPRDPDPKRRSARAALGIRPDQVAVLFSATSRHAERTERLQAAIQGLRTFERLLAITVGPYAHALDELLRLNAPGVPIRHAGYVRDMAPVLLATDVVCLTSHSGTARLAAEGLRFGKPILIARHAPGASLVIPHPSGSPGVVVPSVEAKTWEGAMGRLADASWLGRASRAAAEAGELLALPPFLDRLEAALGLTARR